MTPTYFTPVESCVLHESGWARVGPVEVTCVPVVDGETALFARVDTRRGGLVAERLGARLISRRTAYAVIKESLALGTCIRPVFLPDPKLMTVPRRALGETETAYQTRIRVPMASREWAEIHDLECWHRLESLPVPWDRRSITGNVGKWIQAGAPPGRCYLVGWSLDGRMVQAGTDSGPGPHAGGIVTAAGVEIPGQHDYGTLLMLERDPLPAAA